MIRGKNQSWLKRIIQIPIKSTTLVKGMIAFCFCFVHFFYHLSSIHKEYRLIRIQIFSNLTRNKNNTFNRINSLILCNNNKESPVILYNLKELFCLQNTWYKNKKCFIDDVSILQTPFFVKFFSRFFIFI